MSPAHRRNERLDTLPALNGLIGAIGGKVKPVARLLGASTSSLYKVLSGENSPPTLDTLALYSHRAFRETGIRLIFTVTPDFRLHWRIKQD